MTIIIAVDRDYGGFYFTRSRISARLCLAFISVTVWRFKEQVMLEAMARGAEALKEGS